MKSQAWIRFLPNPIKNKLNNKQGLQKILGNAGWLLVESALRMSINLLVGIWLARYLGPSNFGTYNYVLSLISLFGPISALGLNGIVTRDIVRNPQEDKEILGSAFILRLVASCISLVLVVGSYWLLRPEDELIKVLILILSVGNLFSAFQVIDFWFQSKVLSKYVVLSRTATLLIGTVAKIFLIATKAPLVTFIIVSATEIILLGINLVIAYRIRGGKIMEWRLNFSCAQTLLSQSWPLIISGFGAVINLKIDQVMLGELSTTATVGIYAVAVRLSEVWYFIPEAIASSIFPSLLKSKEQGTKIYKSRQQQLYDLLACGAMVIVIPTTLIATPLLTSLYGEAYRESGLILSIHIWASIFIFMRSALSKWLIAEDLFIFSFVTHGLGAIVNIILNLFLIPSYGGIGAAIATVMSYATSSYLALFVHKKTLNSGYMMTLALITPIRLLLKKTKIDNQK
ncbi:flippase [Mastigocoleus sp. MO_188.B34]|uniref:flippase n=1 Tax=Mastigocoleus sp. MO_188.B34 TaxID=3036635 RepID=UPI002604E10D|nr:flippase [Mastigocoleus sp. MO_188.B34]MDJ0696979.1 flippase [Mastigocoleus sp. MO_188.B34]